MTRFIRCDRCGAEIERDAMRAEVVVDVLSIPGGEAETLFGIMRQQRHNSGLNVDLCADCMRELLGFLKAEMPK